MRSSDSSLPDNQPANAAQEGTLEESTPIPADSLPVVEGSETETTVTEVPAEQETLREVILVWSDQFLPDNDGTRPLAIERLLRANRLLESSGALLWREVRVEPPDMELCRSEALTDFHDPNYVQTVVALSEGQASVWNAGTYGFSQEGFSPYPGMATIAGHYVASARTAVRSVLQGKITRSFSLAGGQPHAAVARAAMGNLFNDVVLALMDARTARKKVAFINLDAEHPILVQEVFEEDSELLMISLHEGPEFLYPGTGAVEEIGSEAGQGHTVNLPLPPATGDAEYLWLFEQVVEPLIDRFVPDLIVVLGGPSAHVADPLSHLRLTAQGYRSLIEKIDQMADRLVVLGGNGSDPNVTARLWSLALAVLCRRVGALPRQLPAAYAQTWGEGLLFDASLPRLTEEMRAYLTRSLRQDVNRLQRLIFPLWDLPVSIEERSEDSDYVRHQPVRTGIPVANEPPERVREVQLRRLTPDEARAVLLSDREEQPSGSNHREKQGQQPGHGRNKRRRRRGGRSRRRRGGPGKQEGGARSSRPTRAKRGDGASKGKRRRRGKQNRRDAPGRNSDAGGKESRGRH